MPPSKMSRLKIQKLTMEVRQDRNAKLMIFRNDRNDTPHLTVSWGNPSKEIDVHLKSRSAGGREEHRKVAILHEHDFIKLLGSFKDTLLHSIIVNLHKIRKVRPGWLGHRGYVVFYMDEYEKSQMMDRIAPLRKYHGKWERIPDMKAFEDWANSPEIINNIYHPSILHDIAADGYDDVIMAGRIRGKHKPKSMALCLVKSSSGRASWVNIDGLIKSMMGISETSTLLCLKQLLPKDAWATIFNELYLEEVGFELA